MTSISSRLKDALWSIRRRFGLETDIDRIMPFVAFEQDLTEDKLNQLFIDYPKRVPEDFKAALIARIQHTIYHYWRYRQTSSGYYKVLKGIFLLENIVRFGFEGCQLFHDPRFGWRLELKAKHRRKK